MSIQQLLPTYLGSQQAYPYFDGDLNLEADTWVSYDASIDWVVDFGDGTPALHQTTPAKGCVGTQFGTTLLAVTFPDQRYAVGGSYTVSATASITGCDGSPGPSASASTLYRWIPGGGVAIDTSAVRSFVPLASWAPPPGYSPAAGMVIVPESPSNPDWGSAPQFLYCAGPASAAPGQRVAITCTYDSTDASTPVQFSCPYGPCSFEQNAAVPVAGTSYGWPADAAVTHIEFTMPTGFAAIGWGFSAHQGPSLVANTEVDVVSAS